MLDQKETVLVSRSWVSSLTCVDILTSECARPAATEGPERARLGRRDNFRTDRDHLSQASLGAVDEDGGVDAGDSVEAGNNYVFMAESTWQFLRANRCRRRVGGTQCVGGTRCDCTPTQVSRTHNSSYLEPPDALSDVRVRDKVS